VVAAPHRLAFAYPGDLTTLTGGYIYDGRLLEGLEARGWKVLRVGLAAGFPTPSEADLEEAARRLGGLPAGVALVVDGLALGAMPEIAAEVARERPLLALVHHPLAYETGLDPALAHGLEASEKAALAAVRHVIVTSPTTRDTLHRAFAVPAARISVALPGTDPRPPARGSEGPGLRLLSVGSVIPRKDHITLIEALARLRHLPWRLEIVGSLKRAPATAEAVRAAIRRHGFDDRVELSGEIEGEALAAAYDRADLVVSTARYEGYGMALAEALAHGLPVCTTEGGAVAEVLPEAARRLVPAADTTALAAALDELMRDPAALARLREGAMQARASLPGWDDTAAAVEGAILEAVAA